MGLQERQRHKRIRSYVIERDGSLCCYCDQVLSDNLITLDHIVPDSKYGTFNTTNLTIACQPCNKRRGNKSFFIYCQQFNWSEDKLAKYHRLYSANLKIKLLNLAKEYYLQTEQAIPNSLLQQACQQLHIKTISFQTYEQQYPFFIRFEELADRRDIKFVFDQLIHILEAEAR